jgi:protein disulfide-isomerase A1
LLLLEPLSQANHLQAGIPLAYIFAETEDERKDLAKELKSLAETYRGKINFATIDAKSFGQHGANLNLEVGKWPAFAIQDTVKNEKFPFDQTKKMTVESITEFVDQYSSGTIKPSIKSEPIPENQDGPVAIVVAHNYKEIIIDNDKDVLVEFYAPWCGHCKALAPKYDELGEKFKKHADKVTIAKVDATANDVPDDVQGFPTIKLFVAGKKDAPVTYTGSRTIEDLAKFIKDNGKYAIDVLEEGAKPAEEKAEDEATGVKEAIKSKVSEAASVVKEAVQDEEVHDEL